MSFSNESKFKVGDKVVAIATSGNYEKDWVGTIIKVDSSDIPYRILYENGKTCWGRAENFKLYNGRKQANTIERVTKLLDKCLEDGLDVTKVTIEFDTGLVVTLKEKE